MPQVKTDHKAGTAHLPQGKAIVRFTTVAEQRSFKSTSGVPATKAADGAGQVNPGIKPEMSSKWAYWGATNNLPQEIIDLLDLCGVGETSILGNIEDIYANGITPVDVIIEKGKEIVTPIDLSKYPEEEDFYLGSDIQDDYALEATTDLVWFSNFFPYFILNKGKNKINKLFLTEATQSRYSIIDSVSKMIELVGVCADWTRPSDIIEIPLLSEYDTLNDLKSRSSGYRFAMKCGFPFPGKSYYQKPYWDSVRKAGWIDIAVSVPKYLKAAFKNAMNIKYHIRIPDEHWKAKFKDWESKTEEDQLKLIDTELADMDKFLAGEENAHKAFISHFRIDSQGKEIPGWEIKAIDDPTIMGKWIPEASAANAEILFAMRRHPDVGGSGADAKGGAARGNSGSNTREADLIKKASLKLYRDRIIKPLGIVKRMNKYPATRQYRMRDTVLTTLDNNSSGTATSLG